MKTTVTTKLTLSGNKVRVSELENALSRFEPSDIVEIHEYKGDVHEPNLVTLTVTKDE